MSLNGDAERELRREGKGGVYVKGMVKGEKEAFLLRP